MSTPQARSGGQLLVDALRVHGADHAFCVPGESYLAVLDALYDAPIEVTVCRQEGGAAMMADAYGKLTGRPGICFVTRGPGATNASAGVHVAHQDSTPMILFIGQVARRTSEREAFQEIDFRRMYGPLCKWVAQIDDAERIPEFVNRAFCTALSGRPGPVVLALPEDMLTDRVVAADAAPCQASHAYPDPQAMQQLRTWLGEAQRPLVIAGGSGWTTQACADLQTFAEANALPVAASFRRQDLMDNRSPHYAGEVGIGINPKLAQRIRDADLLLVAGARLGEKTSSNYTLLDIPQTRQRLVHVHAGAEELGRVYQPDLPILAAPHHFAGAAARLEPLAAPPWRDWCAAAHADFQAWNTPVTAPGDVQMAEIVAWLAERLPDDAIVCNGAGNYATWVQRFYRYRSHPTQLAPTSGSMGYGTPAAVAAKRIHPERIVVGFAGDGCFLMTGQELATAAQYGLGAIFIVVNNGMYGTIRMHQEREYPGRVSATSLVNPDFAALARAYGAMGACVQRTAEFTPAFEAALNHDGPALIEVRIDPEAISPTRTLSAIRKAAQEKAG